MLKPPDFGQYRSLRRDGLDALTKCVEQAHAANGSGDPFFTGADELPPAEAKTLALRRAALRYVLGEEPRPLRVVSEELGVAHSTLNATVHAIAERLGMQFHLKSPEARAAMSEAARKRPKRKTRSGGSERVVIDKETPLRK